MRARVTLRGKTGTSLSPARMIRSQSLTRLSRETSTKLRRPRSVLLLPAPRAGRTTLRKRLLLLQRPQTGMMDLVRSNALAVDEDGADPKVSGVDSGDEDNAAISVDAVAV